jgi:hypothetical protein
VKQIIYLITAMLIFSELAAQNIPNGDFEHSTTLNFFEPSGRISSNPEITHANPAVALFHIPLPPNHKGDIHVLVHDEQQVLVKTHNEHQP